MKKRVFDIFFILFVIIGFCFSDVEFVNAISPPQPLTIERLGRGNIGYTGDMTFDIPVMTVPGRNGLDFPIVLHYRAGIKVDQNPSWVGLGFDLDVGNVERNPISTPDYYPFSFSYPLPYNDEGATLKDQYFVSTPMGSYAFVNVNEGNVQSPNFMPMSWSTQKLEAPTISQFLQEANYFGYDYGMFTMTSTDGTIYVYDLALDDWDRSETQNYEGNYEWKLTTILSNDYVDSNSPNKDYDPLNTDNPNVDNSGNWVRIIYRYNNEDTTGDGIEEVYPSSDRDEDYFHTIRSVGYTNSWNNVYGGNAHAKDITYPWKIITPTHVAIFEVEDCRIYNTMAWQTFAGGGPYIAPDMLGGNSVGYEKRLKSIKLYLNEDGTGEISPSQQSISEVHFVYSDNYTKVSGFYYDIYGSYNALQTYPNGGGLSRTAASMDMGKTTLVAVEWKGPNGLEYSPEQYTLFEYYGYLTSVTRPGSISSYGLPDLQNRDYWGYYHNCDGSSTTCQQIDDLNNLDDNSKVWSISKITKYPQMMNISYTYENDVYVGGDFSIYIREIEQPTFYYSRGGIRVKDVEECDGRGNCYNYHYNYGDGNYGFMSSWPVDAYKYALTMAGVAMNINIATYQDTSTHYVSYNKVTESFPGNRGKIVREYKAADQVQDEVFWEGFANSQSSIFVLPLNPGVVWTGLQISLYAFMNVIDKDWDRGQLLSEKTYTSDGTLIKEVDNTYSNVTKGTSTYWNPDQGGNIINGVSNWKRLDSVTTTLDDVTTTESYEYDDEYGLLRTSTLSAPELPNRITTNMYAYEGALAEYLIERNMISLPYQTWTVDDNDNLLTKQIQEYFIFNPIVGYDI